MIKIAHRGNFSGRNIEKENTWHYLQEAMDAGYDVELDVRYDGLDYWLGHDAPVEKIPLSFLCNSHVWTHAKNLDALMALWHNPDVNVFWHNKDQFTFTSKGIKWAYQDILTSDGIMVMPITYLNDIINGLLMPLGICSDDLTMIL